MNETTDSRENAAPVELPYDGPRYTTSWGITNECFPPTVELFRSSNGRGCLTHIARRLLVPRVPLYSHDRMKLQAHCGFVGYMDDQGHRIEWERVAVADEFFVCARCENKARQRGAETYGMVPNDGCSSWGGRQFGRMAGAQ